MCERCGCLRSTKALKGREEGRRHKRREVLYSMRRERETQWRYTTVSLLDCTVCTVHTQCVHYCRLHRVGWRAFSFSSMRANRSDRQTKVPTRHGNWKSIFSKRRGRVYCTTVLRIDNKIYLYDWSNCMLLLFVILDLKNICLVG